LALWLSWLGAFAAVSAQTDLFTASATTRVLVFVARDCPISNGYAPAIQRLCREYASRGVRCTLVYEDRENTPSAIREHLQEYGYSRLRPPGYGGQADIDTIADGDGRIARRAGASVTPEAIVVDTRGAIRYRGRIDNRYAALGKPRRHVTSHDLRDALEAVLAGRPVARARSTALGCYITSGKSGRGDR
jgi:hypothetical protein